FPYLCGPFRESHYGKAQPIYFNLQQREIIYSWAGFHVAGQYQINSLTYPPGVSFESPFAFYRFDPSAGQYPNLVIRSDIWPASTTFGAAVPLTNRTSLRMTWTGANAQVWHYSLSVSANHMPESNILIGDIPVHAVSYDRLPHWLTEQEWKAVTFVESIDGEIGSEGIYDYSVEDHYALTYWINGRIPQPPINYDMPFIAYKTDIDPRRLKVGIRGEYSVVYNRKPTLYMSPIDNRVHLLYAQGGVWNLGNREALRVKNSTGGPYVDTWTRERLTPPSPQESWPRIVHGIGVEAIYQRDRFLIYSGPDGVELHRLDAPLAQDTIAPPSDAARWRAFLNRVAQTTAAPRDPHNLRSWLGSVASTVQQIPAASVIDVAPLASGMRLIIDLPAQASNGSLLNLAGLKPGKYVIFYDGALHIEPLDPPRVAVHVASSAPKQIALNRVEVSLDNHGNGDLANMTTELWAAADGQPSQLVITTTLRLPAHSLQQTSFDWAPLTPGPWQLTARVVSANTELAAASTVVVVSPTVAADAEHLLAAREGLSGLLTLATLALIVILTTGSLWVIWMRPTEEEA
ncbi:MAG: hypothetical protein HGA19_21565, partial [Oscillochloris sp.]|nr:hypothetical protein [Oscillochloris sp.]